VDTRLGIRRPSGSSPADALALNHLTRCGGLSRSLRFPLLQQRTSQRASGRGREPRWHPCQRERSNRLTPETADPCQLRKKPRPRWPATGGKKLDRMSPLLVTRHVLYRRSPVSATAPIHDPARRGILATGCRWPARRYYVAHQIPAKPNPTDSATIVINCEPVPARPKPPAPCRLLGQPRRDRATTFKGAS
jgi:hypothetical protein